MMSATSSRLEIQVQTVGGEITWFSQDDPEQVQHTLASLGQPSRLFQQPEIVIGGDRSLSVFRSAAVVRIDLVADDLPAWPYLQSAQNIQEITEEMFRLSFRPDEYAAARQEAWMHPGEMQMGFAEIITAGGGHLFWEVLMQSRPLTAADLGPYLHSLLSSGGLHAHRHHRGIMILNPANISRITFYPGPPQLPPNAWHAARL